MVRAHVCISGLVQGVNFRFFTKKEADRRGIKGWVKNLPDGRVEALFKGQKEHVEKMVEWCRVGPPAATVENVDVSWENAVGVVGGFREFRIQY